MADPNNDRKAFTEKVGAKETRKVRARREKEHGLWFGLGLMGTIGWSVAVPMLAGVATGLWIDTKYQSGISWTLTLLFLGLVMGCFNAYYWVKRQLGETQGRQDDE